MGLLQLTEQGLEAINLFIDEFLLILLSQCQTIDIFHIRYTVEQLLGSPLSKLALIEADLEMKREWMHTDLKISDIQIATAQHCTLSDHKYRSSDAIVVYLTFIVEHMAEYLLRSIADQAHTEHICIKEVFGVLLNDKGLSHLFSKMELKRELEKKFPINTPTEKETTVIESNDTFRKNSLKRRLSRFGSKKGRQPPPSPSPLATNFEDLLCSGDTKRVSLTPLRLKSIEVLPPDSPPPTPSPLEDSKKQLVQNIERPSIRVLKRASEGTRPLSYQEDRAMRQNRSGQEKSSELIYVIPSSIPWRPKSKAIDRASQTEDDDEEERRVVTWLLE
ncbi:unnamed protein product [Rhizopus stolonifer]